MKLITLIILLLLSLISNAAVVRLKDTITIKGVRSNPLVGYGLVVGLNGTGDGENNVTNSALQEMLKKMGMDPSKELTSKNVASVIVTAKLPPFARVGQKLDISVSTIGDASSLAGGTLLVTTLRGGDKKAYAIASGNLSIGGLKSGSHFSTIALIPNGGIVEREIKSNFNLKKSLRLNLNNPDFTTAARIERIINQGLGGKFATARDSGTIDLIVPINYQRKIVPLISILENYKVNIDQKAKIIINERTGTVVAGGNIILHDVTISHNNLTIQIGNIAEGGEDQKSTGSVYHVEKKTTLSDLAKALNAFGTKPEDLIAIFQALKSNGALIGDIELI
jgi:flagellar P-ring protein precursor FlgI